MERKGSSLHSEPEDTKINLHSETLLLIGCEGLWPRGPLPSLSPVHLQRVWPVSLGLDPWNGISSSFDATVGCTLLYSLPHNLLIVESDHHILILAELPFTSKCRPWLLSFSFILNLISLVFTQLSQVSKIFWMLFLSFIVLKNISKVGVVHRFGKLELLSSSTSLIKGMGHGHSSSVYVSWDLTAGWPQSTETA